MLSFRVSCPIYKYKQNLLIELLQKLDFAFSIPENRTPVQSEPGKVSIFIQVFFSKFTWHG